MPAVAIADPSLDETFGQQVAITFNPARAGKLFTGSGRTFAEILALSNDGGSAAICVAVTRACESDDRRHQSRESDNVIGVLRGTDPALRNEYVAISAHLDHLGVGEPINGDNIYNGAMDNASGIATLIETAAAAAARGGFKRSVGVCRRHGRGEGAAGFALFRQSHPDAGRHYRRQPEYRHVSAAVSLKSVVVQGLEESDLANDLKKVARPLAIEVLSESGARTQRVRRSDEYSFIKTGVPALSLKVGFTKRTDEHQIVKRWRTERYRRAERRPG